jgi:hypothetical protein
LEMDRIENGSICKETQILPEICSQYGGYGKLGVNFYNVTLRTDLTFRHDGEKLLQNPEGVLHDVTPPSEVELHDVTPPKLDKCRVNINGVKLCYSFLALLCYNTIIAF